MSRKLRILAAVLVAGLISGCGSDRDKGINKNKDKPQHGAPADKPEK